MSSKEVWQESTCAFLMVCDATVARACIAAAGRLRGARAVRLEPRELVAELATTGPRGGSPLVGLESLPEAMRTSVGAVVSPCVVVFASAPEVSVRQDAWRAWPEAPLAQSAWADYVFKKQFLFDRARPVVLAAPGEGADDRYLEHAAAAGAARG